MRIFQNILEADVREADRFVACLVKLLMIEVKTASTYNTKGGQFRHDEGHDPYPCFLYIYI